MENVFFIILRNMTMPSIFILKIKKPWAKIWRLNYCLLRLQASSNFPYRQPSWKADKSASAAQIDRRQRQDFGSKVYWSYGQKRKQRGTLRWHEISQRLVENLPASGRHLPYDRQKSILEHVTVAVPCVNPLRTKFFFLSIFEI